MVTNVGYLKGPMDGQMRKGTGKIRGFLWHLLQMVIAMEIGMGIYHLGVAIIVNPTAYAQLRREIPLFTYWMMVLSMVLAMAIFMRYQKSTWRDCLEMTLAMVAPVIAVSVLVALDIVGIQVLRIAGDPLMILAMAAYMYFRPHDRVHAEHAHAAHA